MCLSCNLSIKWMVDGIWLLSYFLFLIWLLDWFNVNMFSVVETVGKFL